MTARALALPILVAAALALPATPAEEQSCEPVFRLYRSSAAIEGTRIHVATFDSCEKAGDPTPGATYNGGNCEIARSLFQSQPGVTVTYWCER
jgi:hypothetical protein